MPDDSAPDSLPDSLSEFLDRRLPLYAYLEPLWLGKRVLEIARGTRGAELLKTLGAARVVTSESGGEGLAEHFDVVVVPEADALVRRPGAVAGWRRLLVDGGRLVVGVGNGERAGAVGGLGYYELHDALKPHLSTVQMLGVTPFLGVGVVEFEGAVDALRIDSRLVKEPEPPVSYVAIAGAEPVSNLGYALVQLPWTSAAAAAPAPAALGTAKTQVTGAALTSEQSRQLEDAAAAVRVARAQGDEIEELRGRLRRAAEDRATLDSENAKLRRALAEADESVMNLTRRTTEEMAAIADRLAAGLRAAPADDPAARDELDRARVKLAESDARAAAAEQRLEEVAAASRQRQTALDDALERQRLAESELARARRDASRFEAEARASVVDARSIDEQRQALAARDERIARLEGEKQDLVWRLAELEDKLRQSIARAVQGGVARPEAQAAAPLPAPTGQSAGEDPEAVRRARERALEDFHRASAAHVAEITELRAAVSEQMALVAELEDAVTAAEQRAASAGSDAAVLRKTAKDFEEADRSRRTRLAELEGKLLRLEHERKVAAASPDVSPEAERRLADLERERNDLQARIGELEAARAAAAQQNGHAARSENGSAPRGSEVEAGRLENTLGNYRQRAGRLRDGLEGIRRRLESLSPAELSGFLEELGEDLAELG
jgi:hypothetical protein